MSRKLIVGLGNPGVKYQATRHNFGFMQLKAYAKDKVWLFQKDRKFQGEIVKGEVAEQEVVLVCPMTYMNLSGRCIGKLKSFYTVELKDILVIQDDVYLPFGKFRFKKEGGSGGHNGIKSLMDVFHSNQFSRLKFGIGMPLNQALEEYVLEDFTLEEKETLKQSLEQGNEIIDRWIASEENNLIFNQ